MDRQAADCAGLPGIQRAATVCSARRTGRRTYTRIERRLQQLGMARDAIAGQMRVLLLAAAFGGQP